MKAFEDVEIAHTVEKAGNTGRLCDGKKLWYVTSYISFHPKSNLITYQLWYDFLQNYTKLL